MALGKLNEVSDNRSDKSLKLAEPAANETQQRPRRLRDSVAEAVQGYFDQLDGQPATNIYSMVLAEMEAPLLEAVMAYTRDNQTKASEVLGLNRGTLRKKLKQYNML
ncbi:DNA-binding transcriptional regulator Fis [Motiliproteus sp. SC1-56]|uniref:DNA-binding transcriptional regulator Fis n=1 Tax=Motiliproteus sp. SC1-56 TaxID=2799565 RepID=UPI001A8F992C|nr:DNA-binding transcriptional regulator Fis [Motiliproteus sp. SC1-56]